MEERAQRPRDRTSALTLSHDRMKASDQDVASAAQTTWTCRGEICRHTVAVRRSIPAFSPPAAAARDTLSQGHNLTKGSRNWCPAMFNLLWIKTRSVIGWDFVTSQRAALQKLVSAPKVTAQISDIMKSNSWKWKMFVCL